MRVYFSIFLIILLSFTGCYVFNNPVDPEAEDYQGFTTSSEAPATPADLTLTTLSASLIKLDWIDTSSNETGFVIERKIESGPFSELATVGADTTNYDDSSAVGSTTYTYRIRAYNDFGSSPFSNEATDTTP